MKSRVFISIFIILSLTLWLSQELAAEMKYKEGLEALYAGKYNEAIAFFKRQVEKEKIRESWQFTALFAWAGLA